jgi:hypothetical protein
MSHAEAIVPDMAARPVIVSEVAPDTRQPVLHHDSRCFSLSGEERTHGII